MRNCPAWRGAAKTQSALQVQIIDLVHHPVNVIAQPGSHLFDLCIMRQHRRGAIADCGQRIGLEIRARPAAQSRPFASLPVALRQFPPRHRRKNAGGRSCGDPAVQLAQRPRRRHCAGWQRSCRPALPAAHSARRNRRGSYRLSPRTSSTSGAPSIRFRGCRRPCGHWRSRFSPTAPSPRVAA